MAIDGSDNQSVATARKWENAFDKVFEAVVEIRRTTTLAFDTEVATWSYATGFIVDKKRGIILSNRHVVKPGLVVAQATLLNCEEIPVYPLYCDPIHDFGFFHFDPATLEYTKCEEIPLAPEVAAVGLEIWVVGNDSGEKLSVLAGTLARLDGDAPCYEFDGYNDFNTFYMEATAGTKGGSSGSPVIDCHGQAIGLAAGAGGGVVDCASYFLPLDRVVRALRIIQKGMDKGFDEARRLSLQRETEKLVREAFPTGTGLLVIDLVVPGGPADKMQLEASDLLVCVNGEIITNFLSLETVLDDNVGKTIDLEVERDGVRVKAIFEVQDLHSVTPHYFLELSGDVIPRGVH